MVKLFEEFVQKDLEPIKSFELKDDLNRDVWDDWELKEDIRNQLEVIAQDFFEFLEVECDLIDIHLLGSLAGYNWSSYSDFDVHLIINFKDINEDIELVKKYLDAKKVIWNDSHELSIKGYEVELYSQDASEKNSTNGIFSLLHNEWVKKPIREEFVLDEELIKRKAKPLMDKIDEISDMLDENKTYEEIIEEFQKVWKKIKDGRKSGLEKDGEMSTENLVFKLLRRNGYIGKLIEIKTKAYDKQFK